MSKAGGIAYLIKHGKAAMPTVTRTAMPRAKGIKRMADGGLSNANAPLNYGTVPDYVFVPGGMEISADGKPVFKSGRYELREKAAASTPAAGATGSVGVPTTVPDTGSGGVGSNVMAPSGSGDPERPRTASEMFNPINAAGYNIGYDSKKGAMGAAAMGSPLGGLAGVSVSRDPLGRFAYEQLVAQEAREAAEPFVPGPGYTPYFAGNVTPPDTSGIAALDPSSPDFTGPQAPADTGSGSYSPPDTGSFGGSGTEGSNGPGDGTAADYARGGRIQRMATGGIGALSDHGGFVGSYAQGGRMLKGPGDGLSDHIPAVIGKNKPARLADGEFVVSADVVSGLGGGSTEAGARKLYAMMDRIRKAAHGTKKQVKPVSDKKVLPA